MLLQDEEADKGREMYTCVNDSSNNAVLPAFNKLPRSLQLMTFATRRNWEEYGGWSSAINVAYAQAHGYAMTMQQIIDEENESVEAFCKIKTLYFALQQQPKFEYVVWVDADLIFLDTHGKKLEEILSVKYRKADLIMSREQHTSFDNIACTGFIVVRNTAWSKKFLHLWWNDLARARERGLKTPEQVFNKLWHDQHSEVSEHVELLSPRALDTRHLTNRAAPFPGHRKAIFARGLAALCEWHNTSKSMKKSNSKQARLKPQLGLTRQAMRDIETHLLGERRQKTIELLAALSKAETNNYSACQFVLVEELKIKLFDVILKLGDARVGSDVELIQECLTKFFELTQHLLLQRQSEPNVEVEVEVDAQGMQERQKQQKQQETLALLRYAVDVSFELARGKPNLQQVEVMLHVTPFTAELLAKSDHQTHLVEALSLESKRFQILAEADHDKQLEHLQAALKVWFELHQQTPKGDKGIVEEGASLLARIGSIMCTKKIGAYEQGLAASLNSTHLLEEYWEKYHGGGPAAVPRSVLHSLAKTYRTMGSCADRQAQSNCTLAKEYFEKALSMRRYLSKWDELTPEEGEEEMSLRKENKNEMVLLLENIQVCGEEEETTDEE